MTQISGFDVPYELSPALQGILAEFARVKRAAKKLTGKPTKRRAPRHAGWTRKEIFAEKCRLVYILNDPKIGEGDAVLPGVQLPSKQTRKGASVPMHTAVSGLAWQAHDEFARVCRMDGSDLVIGKMAVALAPIFDVDALNYLAAFDDRAAQIPGRVKRAIGASMIGKSAFKAHHKRVDVARGKVVKQIIWWFINSAIRTPADAPLIGENGTVVVSNRMGFVVEMFELLKPEFKKVWAANKSSNKTSSDKSRDDRGGKGKRQKNYKRDGARGGKANLAAAAKAMAETPSGD